MIIQGTLITGHKGVDLHAETAARVMARELADGDKLQSLHRAEFHTFWRDEQAAGPESVARLLNVGRFFNPNKHHYGHFELSDAGGTWFAHENGDSTPALPDQWPGRIVNTDLTGDQDILTGLLGGPEADGNHRVDVACFPLGEEGPLLSGVFWRLVLTAETPDPLATARKLVVARSAREGLLVNPHMQGFKLALRG